MTTQTCHDCGCREGELHRFFPHCDMEICPFCGGQLLSCHCKYKQLGIMDKSKYTAKTAWLPPTTYHQGLTTKQMARWELMLTSKGRIPYIRYPVRCARCGADDFQFFTVSSADWMRYIQPDMRDKVICKDCYRQIMQVVDYYALLRGEPIPPTPNPDNPLRELGFTDHSWSSDDAYGWHHAQSTLRENAKITTDWIAFLTTST